MKRTTKTLFSASGFAILALILAILASPVLAQSNPDPRLDQKVTYEPGYTRLHHVTEDLSKLTGVQIEAGKNSDDWKTRDLPMTVYAKDIRLGTLLQAVADATRVGLTCSDSCGKQVYRLAMTSAREEEIASRYAKSRKADYQTDRKAWDILVKHAKIPKEELDLSDGVLSRRLARILATLTPKQKKMLFSGKTIELNIAQIRKRQLLLDLYDALVMDERYESQIPEDGYPTYPTRKQLNTCLLVIGREPDTHSGDNSNIISAELFTRGVVNGETTFRCWYIGSLQAEATIILPDRPTIKAPNLLRECDCNDLHGDYVNVSRNSGKKSGLAILNKPISLTTSTPYSGLQQVLSAIHKETGYAVVCEDFLAYHTGPPDEVSAMEEENWTPESVKGTVGSFLGSHQDSCLYQQNWYMDQKNKVFLGVDPDWISSRDNLIAEKVIHHLIDCANSRGIELDDALMLAPYTDTAIWTHWYNKILGLPFYMFTGRMDRVLWTYYAGLSAEQKAKVNSPDGLVLTNFDRAWFEKKYGFCKRIDPELLCQSGDGPIVSPFAGMIHPRLRMELEKEDNPQSRLYGLFYHTLVLEEPGRPKVAPIRCSVIGFPVYSNKKEAELEQQSAKGDKQ